VGTGGVGTDHAGVSAAERGRGGGWALDGGSCADVAVDTAKIFSVRGGGVYQGKESDRHSSEIYGPGEEFHRAKLLGAAVLRCGSSKLTLGGDTISKVDPARSLS
jgi:hypothetical protein